MSASSRAAALSVASATTYAELIAAAADRAPQDEVLIFSDARRTYGELLKRSSQRAIELRVLGVKHGDRVGVLMPNAPEIIELLAATAMIGAILVPINTRFKVRELRHVITNAELTVLFTTSVIDEYVNFKTLLAEVLPGLTEQPDPAHLRLIDAPSLRAIVLIGDRGSPGFLAATALRELAANTSIELGAGARADDAALILYTSGTTADPKGCVLSHRAILMDARGIAERFAIPPNDRWWNPLPMFHGGGIMLLTGCIVAGAAEISMPRFEVEAAFDLIEREDVTLLYPLFPPITMTLMHHPRFAGLDLSRIRVVVNVGPEDVQRKIQERFAPAILIGAYGITELCATVVFAELGDPLDVRLATCGTPMPGFELRIVDPETGRVLGPGERGEMVGRGPSLFDGYFRDPKRTAEVIDENGFFHTGDICSIDEDGRVRYHGRIKDMLKVGGENVAAVEVESFLATHPAVKLAQVVGIPDERLVEVPAAFIELVPGMQLTEEETIAFCRGAIAGYKVPRHVRFVTQWPMSATKVQKFRLREQLIAELSQA
jgi:acyl-CoA synthetase (AMP-forming)/AMP-acid ligase II